MAKPVALVHLSGQTSQLMNVLSRESMDCRFVACAAEEDVRERIADAEILVATPVSMAPSSAHDLRWVQSLSAGVEGWLDSIPATVPITRMTGVYERYIAEYVFAHLLFERQRLGELAQAQLQHAWQSVNTRNLSGLTMGIAGVGFVGREVARVAKAFGMSTKCLGRRERPALEMERLCDRYYTRLGFYDFLAGLDVLVLTLPATPQTDRMFGPREINALPRGAVVINVARGQLIDEDALLIALRDGQLGRAVIDTFRREPLPVDDPLWGAPNITITPHMAGAVYPEELGPFVVRNVQSFLAGRIPAPVVDRLAGY